MDLKGTERLHPSEAVMTTAALGDGPRTAGPRRWIPGHRSAMRGPHDWPLLQKGKLRHSEIEQCA